MNDILGVLMNLLIFLLILAKKFIESFFFFLSWQNSIPSGNTNFMASNYFEGT